MEIFPGRHLTYCTNIHPGEEFSDIRRNLRNEVARVKSEVSPHRDFGLGLRLSRRACQELLEGENVRRLEELCRELGMYIFTLNGFVYGEFHDTRVKEKVYLPDWREEARLSYTRDLALVLSRLLGKEPWGSISTVPGGFKRDIATEEDRLRVACQLAKCMAYLYRLEQESGKGIGVALEPEPCCFLETTEEVVSFFQDYLFEGPALLDLQREIGQGRSDCENFLRGHLGICYDACHAAVEFEEPVLSFRRLQEAGIRVFKTQISNALRISFQQEDDRIAQVLSPFAEEVYLHQVVEKREGRFTRYEDLPLALKNLARSPGKGLAEWRIHFHVPIFMAKNGDLDTTQEDLRETMHGMLQSSCTHFEVETYTFHVLPPEYREEEVSRSVSRELEWAIAQIT